MAIAQAQYVDLLVKQLYGVAKTDTNIIKSPSNESIASPALIRGDTQWTQSDQIPAIAAAVTDLIQSYKGVDAIECTPDTTTVPVGGVYPTWLTGLTNWIPQEFGATYVVQAWVDNSGVANPTVTGTQIFASGSGGTGEYYFDNIAGLLNFIGGTIPAVLTSSKVIYIVGYRYIGLVGVTHLPSNTYVGNLNFTGTTISSINSNGNIILAPNGTGIIDASSSNISASYFIGNGSQLTGVSAGNAVTAETVTASAQPNITSVGTLISLDITGNLTAGNANLGNLTTSNYFSGSGNLLSNIQGANVTGNVTSAITSNFANYAGNVTVSSQPNITSVGSLTSLSVTGNATVGNLVTTGSGGNISGANVISANTFIGNLVGNISGNVVIPGSNTGVVFNDDGNANSSTAFTFDKTSNLVTITGNLSTGNANLGNAATANYFIGSGNNLSNIQGSNVTGNITSAITANFANFAGNITVSSQPNITSVGTLTSLSVSGNLSSGNANLGNAASANYFIGSGNNLSNIQGSNVTGNVTSAVTANFANYAGNVTVSSQPNITSLGTLVSLDITGNLTSGNANTGNLNATNIIAGSGSGGNITGANLVSANYFTGTLTTSSQPNITSVGTLISLSVTGNLSAGNVDAGNLLTANFVSGVLTTAAQPNITSVGTLSSLDITGNLSAGNGNLGNAASANYFIGSGNNLSNIQGSNVTGNVTSAVTANFANFAGNVTENAQPNITSVGTLTSLTVTGNVAGGNLTTGGQVVATGNGTFGNLSTTGSGGNISGANNVSANTFTGTLTTNAQPNITSVGTLISLDITGNLSSGNANLGNAATANYFIGSGNNLSNIQGSNVTGNVTSAVTANFANYAGNVTVAAQPNITSVGTLTSLDVSGNANTGNLGTNNFIATGTGSFGANVNLNTYWINNVGYPNLSTDAASKAYVDTMVSSGISYHQPVLAATTTTLATATGGTTAYNSPNGASNGIGAYISTTGTFDLIDSANVQTVGTRILVKDEANAAWNGIYTYANTTAIVRSTDADQYGPDSTEQLSVNDFFFTTGGVVNEGTGFVVSAPLGTITFGTSNITFAIFTTAQVYDAGTGLTLTGTTFSISNTAVTAGSYGNGDTVATFTVNDQGQLTAAANTVITANAANLTGTTLASSIVTTSITSTGTLISLDVTGNITSGNVYANSGTIGASLLTGTLTSSSQPNVTSVGTLTGLNVNGNITAANITANTGIFTGNGSGLTAITGANVTGEVAFANVANNIAGANVSGEVAFANVANNVAGSNVSGEVAFANVANNVAGANVSGEVDYAAVANSVAGSNVSGQVANALIAGTVYTAAQPTITSVGNLTSLTVIGNISGGNVTTDGQVVATGNGTFGNLLITGSGNISGANNISATTVTGALTTASQPNITSVGNLTSLNVNGLSNLGPVSNLTITGGINGYYLQTDGSGGLSWAYVAPGTGITNGTSNVVISTPDGNITMSVGNIANIVTITDIGANVNGILNVNGNLIASNANLGNAVTASYFIGSGANLINIPAANISGQVANALVAGTVYSSAQGNITSVGTLTSLDVTGNITAGNANLGNAVSATYFVGNGSLLTGIATATTAAAVANGTSNVNIPFINGNINLSASGNPNVLVVTSTGANITGTANVDGNLIATNIISGPGAGGSITGANLVSANYFTGTLTTASQPNITSIGTLTGLIIGNSTANVTYNTDGNGSLTATGNITAANFIGNVVGNISGNIVIPGSNTSVVFNDSGNANTSTAFTFDKVSNVVTITGNANVGNLGTGGLIIANGNISGGNFNTSGSVTASRLVSNVATGTAPLTVTSTTQVANLNVATAGTVTASAQSNITSTGILTGLDISGHLIANTFQMGYDVYAFYSTSVYFATTASTASGQILWSYPAADLSAIDFTIIATDNVDGTRQSCKISAAILGTSVAFNEYGGLFINGGVGSFSVVYNSGTSTLDLVVTPDSSNLTEYNMLISKYLV